ncbi:MAG: FAD-dependent oxidoreductase [Campylobacterota bacterium]|nr:FAD-dependent oxidoreductase [Campylobacterota bacterium]
MNEVLIIGSGGAGLVAALSCIEEGVSVKVISKTYPTRSQTVMAQGGINAALHVEDSVEQHIKDTQKSSHDLALHVNIEKLCSEAPEAIEFLDSIGVPFSRDESGKIAQRRLGAAASPRACYAQDFSGLKIVHTLYDTCVKKGVEFINDRFLLNFVKSEDGKSVCGVDMLNVATGEVEQYLSSAVIIATGGYSKIYHHHSTNSQGSTGDGIAAAVRAGAKVNNMEFIQFHPTALKNSSVLISESARGAGGYLLNDKKERFVDELLPRDELSRAIVKELEKSSTIYLDVRHLGEEFIDENLPQERHLAKLYENVDIVKEIVPIKPAAHYSMGGIEIGENLETNIKGLFAVGECANHNVHGANRLGGNSLLEIIVFGKQVGINAALHVKSAEIKSVDESQLNLDKNFVAGVKHFTNQIDFYEKREFIGNIFYNNAGVVRDDMGLKAVLGAIRQIQREIPFMGPRDKSMQYNTNLVEFIEFGNMVELCEIIIVGAISRVESRGAHFRSDAASKNDTLYKAKTQSYKADGILCVDFKAVK